MAAPTAISSSVDTHAGVFFPRFDCGPDKREFWSWISRVALGSTYKRQAGSAAASYTKAESAHAVDSTASVDPSPSATDFAAAAVVSDTTDQTTVFPREVEAHIVVNCSLVPDAAEAC
jgi:hypothetical protein